MFFWILSAGVNLSLQTFLISGKCWRGSSCVYLHKTEHFDSVEHEDTFEKDSDVEKDENEEESNFVDRADEKDVYKDKNNDDNMHVPYENQEEVQDVSEATISTEEIIKMYENVELAVNDEKQISTDDILRMYDTEKDIENSCILQKSTRKIKNKKSNQIKKS